MFPLLPVRGKTSYNRLNELLFHAGRDSRDMPFLQHDSSLGEAPSSAIEVAIVDKSPLVLRGLKAMLVEDERFTLAVSATDGERFLEAVDRIRFDVAVIGWAMPYCNGRDVLEALAERDGQVPRIIVYTGDAAPSTPREVLQLGGAGFCSKTDTPEHLLDVIESVARGQMVFPFMRPEPGEGQGVGRAHKLTPREEELLRALGSGNTNAEIARLLGVSPNTVKFHLRNLYSKLDVRNRAEAVARHLAPREK